MKKFGWLIIVGIALLLFVIIYLDLEFCFEPFEVLATST